VKLRLLIIAVAMLLARGACAGAPAMPNPRLTPGAVRPDATAAQLCSPRFHTGAVRAVDESVKRKVYAEYGRAPKKGICCEVDHLISLELGGSNDIANLWPQPYAPAPGAHQKDLVENWLHRQVCRGALPLKRAQHEIATDWFAVYRAMTAAQKSAAGRRR
jgi:hypothetical protein